MVNQMNKGQTYEGIVVTGRGGGAVIMSAPSILEHLQRWTGLAIIPGTLNVSLNQPFDVASVRYVALAPFSASSNQQSRDPRSGKPLSPHLNAS